MKRNSDRMMEKLIGPKPGITEFEVKAQAFSRRTGMPKGLPRTERVNVRTNIVFRNASTIMDVKEAYEAFWNRLNPDSSEVVFVQQVTPVGRSK